MGSLGDISLKEWDVICPFKVLAFLLVLTEWTMYNFGIGVSPSVSLVSNGFFSLSVDSPSLSYMCVLSDSGSVPSNYAGSTGSKGDLADSFSPDVVSGPFGGLFVLGAWCDLGNSGVPMVAVTKGGKVALRGGERVIGGMSRMITRTCNLPISTVAILIRNCGFSSVNITNRLLDSGGWRLVGVGKRWGGSPFWIRAGGRLLCLVSWVRLVIDVILCLWVYLKMVTVLFFGGLRFR